ncbi:MAG: SirB2 family protein [Alcaligenaceae bacterium]|nr:SirB2 family protein [Alcaligenaceae bacterium]
MNYLLIKHLHMTAAGLSIFFFIIRAYWSITENGLLQKKAVKIAPHIIDTVLLAAAIWLSILLGPAAAQPWVLTKIVLLIAYIGVGTIAIKRGCTPRSRAIAAVIAVLIFAYIVGVAIKHHPASWFF